MAYLINKKGGTTIQFPIDKPKVTLGRHKDNDICIDDTLVSKAHLVIETVESEDSVNGPEYFIEDLNSTNHTYVNNRKITRKKLLNNDMIRVGVTIFVFVEYEEEDYESTAIIKKSWIPGVYYTKEKDSQKNKENSGKKKKK